MFEDRFNEDGLGNEVLKYLLENANGVKYSFFKVVNAGVICTEYASGNEREYPRELIFEIVDAMLKKGGQK